MEPIAFYNENDPKTAAWLRELIKAGLIAPGIVDERSIVDIQPHELDRFTQCHFFAGIGGWSYALRLAGIQDKEAIWTGSCPCQPLSCAGQRKGHADERHLWPAFYRLIAERNPAILFGEQVASPDGLEWFAGIRADLEGTGRAVGGADLCAAGVGSPHPRQRLYWMAHSQGSKRQFSRGARSGRKGFANGCATRGMGNANGAGSQPRRQAAEANGHRHSTEPASSDGWMGNPDNQGLEGQRGFERQPETQRREGPQRHSAETSGLGGFWDAYDICRFTGADAGKTRRIEPGTFPLADGLPARMVRLRGYGNAIVPEVAAQFIQASLEAIG